MRERRWQILWGVLRVPSFSARSASPLSNYNQIKDRVFVARHHWGVWRYHARHTIKTQITSRFADFVYSKERFFYRKVPSGAGNL
jgi:hypothetical protein